jgi:hypothetical protein
MVIPWGCRVVRAIQRDYEDGANIYEAGSAASASLFLRRRHSLTRVPHVALRQHFTLHFLRSSQYQCVLGEGIGADRHRMIVPPGDEFSRKAACVTSKRK